MRQARCILALGLAVLLAACAPSTPPAPALPTLVLDGEPAGAAQGVSASAVVVPAQEARLAFTIAGRVQTVHVRVGDTVKAGDALVSLETAALEAEVLRAQGALQTAQADLDRLIRFGEVSERIRSAQGLVMQAQAALDAAQAALAQAQLTAPFAGTIAAVEVVAGETVAPGQVIVTLGDLSSLQIETTDLSERDAPYVSIGQQALVYVEALDREISGEVTAIAPIAETVGGDVVYRVTIRLDELPEGLRWGMSAEVQIITQR